MDFDDAVHGVQGVSAKVHIGSLSPYFHFGGGIYTMTDVKRMRSTVAFLEMPLGQRNCKVELFEDCRTRKLLGECNCLPWEMPGSQVGISNIKRLSRSSPFSTGVEDLQPRGTRLH